MSAPSRIGLIATLLSSAANYRSAGIHTYCYQLLRHLPADGQFAYHAWVADPAYEAPSAATIHRVPWWGGRPTLRIFWEQSFLAAQTRSQRLHLLHGLAYSTPLGTALPVVVTVHDLSFLRFPSSFRPANRLYLAWITKLSCRRSRRVIAVSQATAADLVQVLGIPAGRIEVIANGVDESFHSYLAADVARYRQQAGWPDRFLLTVGTLEPRKNHLMLLDAYARYRQQTAYPLPLLIAGGKGWYYDTIYQRVAALGIAQHVHFLGFVPTEQLPWLYNAAEVFIYPSRYEGFGLPVAEAMSCGAPTITTNVSSLPEVAGDAGLLVSPDDPDFLAEVLVTVLADTDRLQAMRQASVRQGQRFRWSITAAQTASLYHRVLAA